MQTFNCQGLEEKRQNFQQFMAWDSKWSYRWYMLHLDHIATKRKPCRIRSTAALEELPSQYLPRFTQVKHSGQQVSSVMLWAALEKLRRHLSSIHPSQAFRATGILCDALRCKIHDNAQNEQGCSQNLGDRIYKITIFMSVSHMHGRASFLNGCHQISNWHLQNVLSTR